jgi:iron complex transport system ATP-binding protein
MLEVDDLSVAFGGAVVLQGVSARVGRGGWLGLVGPNGAGKTTLLRAVLGLVPYGGEVRIDGRRPRGDRRATARLAAYVPQRPVLPPAMTVVDYVLLGRSPHRGLLGAETAADRDAAASALERLDLARLATRPLGAVSGGEAQRAVLARALAQQAPVLVMDEPTASLDLGHAQAVLELADQLRRERDLVVLSALHDLTLAGQYADQLLLLAGGQPVASGSPRDVVTEANLTKVFGASVRVAADPAGGVTVLPVRVPPPPRNAEPVPAPPLRAHAGTTRGGWRRRSPRARPRSGPAA